ncbi:unnamed protein product [Paramecium octaurelia]|uniref:Uncharacterized protein n=1 Tax=Paramecium octaurelia TaxID=43137 RepID=A0A8S1UCR7_PAROT|nr:unnamed protein product [Paramecium octaurelia]
MISSSTIIDQYLVQDDQRGKLISVLQAIGNILPNIIMSSKQSQMCQLPFFSTHAQKICRLMKILLQKRIIIIIIALYNRKKTNKFCCLNCLNLKKIGNQIYSYEQAIRFQGNGWPNHISMSFRALYHTGIHFQIPILKKSLVYLCYVKIKKIKKSYFLFDFFEVKKQLLGLVVGLAAMIMKLFSMQCNPP